MINSLTFNTRTPVSFDNMTIEFNKLSLLVGQNGVGKSFMLVNAWALSILASKPIKEVAQFLYDRSFTRQNIDGTVSMNFNTDNNLTVTFDQGKVVDVKMDKEIEENISITYLSADMRTFNDISSYLKMRKTINPQTDENIVDKMSSIYRIYDVIYIERLIKRMPVTIDVKIEEHLTNLGFTNKIESINVDLNEGDFYTKTSASMKWCTMYSKGEQSVLNMVVGSTP